MGLGFGLDLSLGSNPSPTPAPTPSGPQSLGPGALWDGTAGSGYAGSEPVDPSRTLGKPSLRELFIPWTTFDGDFVIGFASDAFGDVESVEIFCEGESVVVTEKTTETYTRSDGADNGYSYGYHARLDFASFQSVIAKGSLHIYAKATPNDPDLQARVVGPFLLHAYDVVNDIALDVAPSLSVVAGSRYQTIKAALDYCRTNSKIRPVITLKENGDYLVASVASFFHGNTTLARIQADTGISARLIGGGVDSLLRPGYDGLELYGAGIQIDPGTFSTWYVENTSPSNMALVFNGCRVEQDGGRSLLRNGKGPGGYWLRTKSASVPVKYYFKDVTANEVFNGLSYGELLLGCTVTGVVGDALQLNRCMQFVTMQDLDPSAFRDHVDAMRIEYVGAGASGTLECSSTPNVTTGSNRTLLLKVDGVAVDAGFTITNPASGTSYTTYQDLVDYIDGLADWTASIIDNTRRACSISHSSLVPSATLPATECKVGGGVVFTSIFDIHADVVQLWGSGLTGGIIENTNYSRIRFIDIHDGKTLYVDKSGTVLYDAHFSNMEMNGSSIEPNQWLSVNSHVTYRNGVHVGMEWLLRTDEAGSDKFNPDGKCEMSNSVFRSLTWSGAQDANFGLPNNHYIQANGGDVVPAGSTGDSSGSTAAALFAGLASNDFTPAAAGTLQRADGEYKGSRLPSGEWNTA